MNQHPFDTDNELDDEIKDLERLLGDLRFVPRSLNLDAIVPRTIDPSASQGSRFSFSHFAYAAPLAAGIALTFVVAALWFSWFMPTSSIIVESSNAPTITDANFSLNSSSTNSDTPQSSAMVASNKIPEIVLATSTPTPRRPARLSIRRAMRRNEFAGEYLAKSPDAKPKVIPPSPSSAQAEEAARDLLLALNVTENSLDATRQQIETHFAAVRIPVFSDMTGAP